MQRQTDRHKAPRVYTSGYQKAQKRKAKEERESEVLSKILKLDTFFKDLSSPQTAQSQLHSSVPVCFKDFLLIIKKIYIY